MQETKIRWPFKYTVWDKYEDRLVGTVMAVDEDEATEEAMIAASERGCTMIEDVSVEQVFP